MIWILSLLYAVFAYYFIFKSDAETSSKAFSLLSGALLIVVMAPFWSTNLFMVLIEISTFSPFIIGVLGIVFGWFGVKDGVRGTLVITNILAMLFYLVVFLIGVFGFQEP